MTNSLRVRWDGRWRRKAVGLGHPTEWVRTGSFDWGDRTRAMRVTVAVNKQDEDDRFCRGFQIRVVFGGSGGETTKSLTTAQETMRDAQAEAIRRARHLAETERDIAIHREEETT